MGQQMSGETLELLWRRLGLDSLPPDAGTAESLHETRRDNWDDSTVRAVSAKVTEREDLPRITLSSPQLDGAAGERGRELQVTGVLGEGGMGRVLLARQASLGRDVAVKVARTGATHGDLAALTHEALMTGGMEHPGVIPVYQLASDAHGNPALVMKRVDGVSWAMLLRHADDPVWNHIASPGAERLDSHIEILRQVCNAIAFAHRKGVTARACSTATSSRPTCSSASSARCTSPTGASRAPRTARRASPRWWARRSTSRRRWPRATTRRWTSAPTSSSSARRCTRC
jgi:hypothetical protein